ncbi:EAL domain-containing protein [Aliikangiella coralliicola]|uniref:EAL domain-containing protein n=1 Tax=Aliikangiella coralliicola TaxID=2592383 RepID=A0A545UAG6_9GAMM|nr:EAL domain-containing protein [Aliikangiella coralliicola]TQV86413.1 EAL domain-containing protein [Aliikangiella coralliicola]
MYDEAIRTLFRLMRNLITTIFLIAVNILTSTYAASPVSFSEQERAFLSSIKEINLCVGPDSMPLDDIVRGSHTGINAEYMKIFENILDTPIRLVITNNWNESLDFVKQGKCDIISLASKTPQRESYLTFTETYVNIPFVVVTTQEKFFVSKMSDLVDQELGVRRGYAYVDLLKNRFPKIKLVEFETLHDGLDMVNRGKIFGYLSGLHIVGYAIQTGGYTNLKINGQFDELSTIQLGIGVRKEMAPLRDIFNKAIAAIDPEDKKRIDSSWLTVRYEIVEDYQRIIQLAIAASIILIFLAYRQFHLRKHNVQLAEREKEIWNQANFDFLTGLPNRRLFQDRLAQKISRISRKGEPFALVLIDLDEFKEVNDTLGHDQGDQLLIEASERIKSCLRQSDTLARLGGDEFVVILNDINRDGGVETVAQKILNSLKAPFRLKENAFISASVGITLCPKDSKDMVEILKNADQAMYAAKANGRNNFHYFTPSMQQEAMVRMLLIKELRIAIEEQQFELFFQPIVDLTSGAIDKAEALIRWKHPTKGYVSPIEFIPILEETRMIIKVGKWVFIESVKQAKIWRKRYHPNFQVSVNTSPLQFQSNSTIDWHLLTKNMGLAAQAIGIEITESMLMEGHDDISSHLLKLRDNGFQVSLDDFGTGYSSLSYLRKFDIDYLKIDKSFVKNLSDGSDDMVLCEAIIVMAHKLGLKVIAEGVENNVQQRLLAHANCDYGQGYHFAKPIPADEFELLLEKQAQAQAKYNVASEHSA